VWRHEGVVPPEIAWASAHAVAYAELLELALRLKMLSKVPGLASVRRALRKDLRGQRRVHTRLQLEVAALAQMLSPDVALESIVRGDAPPVDVQFNGAGGLIAVETKVITRDDIAQAGVAFWDALNDRLDPIRFKYGVEFGGQLQVKLTPTELAACVAALDTAAAQVQASDQEQTVASEVGAIRVVPVGKVSDISFSGPVESSDGWPRVGSVLRQKADQAVRAGATWLRVDVMDGLWQLTPWAAWALPAKVDALATAVRHVLGGTVGLDGAVLTSSACLAWGEFHDEICHEAGGAIGLRGLISPVRVRESVVVPLHEAAQRDADIWVQLYDGESAWLDWALSQLDLPLGSDVFSWVADSTHATD